IVSGLTPTAFETRHYPPEFRAAKPPRGTFSPAEAKAKAPAGGFSALPVRWYTVGARRDGGDGSVRFLFHFQGEPESPESPRVRACRIRPQRAAMLNIRLASATAFALSLSSPLSMADDASAAGAQRRVKAAKGTKAAKGIKGGAAAVNGGKSAKGDRQRGKLLQCGREILGTHIYGGSCGNTFAVTIGCEDDESLGGCHYREVSLDESTSHDVCYPFNMMDLLSVNHNTCELGFTNGGIPLKNAADVSDRYCTPKYVLRMTTEIGKEASGELKLYFSNDGGVSFYNKEEPRIATWVASEDEIHSRRAEVCVSTSSSCFNDGEVCTVGNGQLSSMVTILKGTMLTGIGTKQKLLITALASPLGRRAGLKRVPGLLLRVWVEIWAAFYFLIGNFPLRIKKSNQLVTESGMVAALGKLFLIMLSKSQGQEFSGAIIELCTTSAGEAEGAIDQYFPFGRLWFTTKLLSAELKRIRCTAGCILFDDLSPEAGTELTSRPLSSPPIPTTIAYDTLDRRHLFGYAGQRISVL
ncbi:hypothetical protein THAOC_06189, partial [Thalassiosira oceanica]